MESNTEIRGNSPNARAKKEKNKQKGAARGKGVKRAEVWDWVEETG